MLAPVLVQNEQQLLSSSKGEYRKQCSASAIQNIGDGLHQLCLAFDTRGVCRDTEGRLGDEDIDLDFLRY